jgi:glycosyltransferase involved in cell wall biosynthesis
VTLLHYSAAPVVGGVERVIQAQARLFLESGYRVCVVAGRGEIAALPEGAEFVRIPELDSQHPAVRQVSQELEQGRLPAGFAPLSAGLEEALRLPLGASDLVIAHNVFSKHFNLPLTAALFRLLDQQQVRHCAAWCHDLTWTSPHSRSKVFPGYPWDLLRTYRPDLTYVTVSQARRDELAGLLECPSEQIRVIYNGVDPQQLLGLSEAGMALAGGLGLWESDLNLLMPVRITQAKNIELAIEVAAALKKQGLRPRVVVTGPPDPHDEQNMAYFADLQARRAAAGVEQEVRFVCEEGADPEKPLLVSGAVLSDLYRASDALFLPSHREGFGMPVLEAGLVGLPVFTSDRVPAGREIGGDDVISFSPEAGPEAVADLVLSWLEGGGVQRLRRQVRQELTWQSIFQRQVLPLLPADARREEQPASEDTRPAGTQAGGGGEEGRR